MTTETGNKFLSSFSSWILDNGVIDRICSSFTHFTSYYQINPIYVKLPNGNKVIVNYSGFVFSQSKSCHRQCFVYSLFHF